MTTWILSAATLVALALLAVPAGAQPLDTTSTFVALQPPGTASTLAPPAPHPVSAGGPEPPAAGSRPGEARGAATKALEAPLAAVAGQSNPTDSASPVDLNLEAAVNLDDLDAGLGAGTGGIGLDVEGLDTAVDGLGSEPGNALPSVGGAAGAAILVGTPAAAAAGYAATHPQVFARAADAVASSGIGRAARRLAACVLGALSFLPFVGGFSRIKQAEILDNRVRASAMDYVSSNPGATIQQVQCATGVAWGTVVYHLRRLEHAGLLVSLRDGRMHRYWDAACPQARNRRTQILLENETARRLAMTVRAEPGLTQGALCSRVGVSAPVASKYLRRLADEKLVAVSAEGSRRRYEPTPALVACDALAMEQPLVVVGPPQPRPVAAVAA